MTDMKKAAIPPRVLNPDSTIIQQLGLNTPLGMQRLIMMLVHKLDPQGTGAVLTEADIRSFVDTVTSGRKNISVIGQNNSLHLKLCDDAESKRLVEFERAQRVGTKQ